MTYAELTSNYCLTADPDRSVFNDYFRAAGQRGIPCAFIVGKDGFVEWIGHPMRMDDPLEQVVEGTWDREAYAEKIKEEQRQQALAAKAQRALQGKMQEIQQLIDDGEAAKGVAILDEMIEDENYAQFKPRMEMMRSQLLVMHVGGNEGAKALRQIGEQQRNNPELLNEITWTLYEKHAGGDDIGKEMLDAAAEVAEIAMKAAPRNAAIMDTVAHLVYEQGNLDRAIELQEKAVELADEEMKEELQEFLDKLKKEKEKG